jgi:hypothetical protein
MSNEMEQLRPGDLVTIRRGEEPVEVAITEVESGSLRGVIQGSRESEPITFPYSEVVAVYRADSGADQGGPEAAGATPARRIASTRRGKPSISERWIARTAYYTWEKEGRPHGRDLDHWLHAEREARRLVEARETVPAPQS